ncbi:methyl-accepting chemotaxis protein [Anaerolineales bacterium HSG6]|nr:methyl-accepting chemotaxis protein [Anaerolineales bacterium HSG6]MDM8530986.1 methyl-accepting chemotaxis protein [Anaerolineales bacterium HSG25]
MFNRFNDLAVSYKIISGYVIALLLMAVVGGIAIVRLDDINATVEELATDLAEDQRLADKIIEHTLLMRFYANRYIRNHEEVDLQYYNSEYQNLQDFLAQADANITNEQRRELLSQITKSVARYQTTFAEIISLINERNEILDTVLNVSGPQVEDMLQQLRSSAFSDDDGNASFYAGEAQRAFLLMRFNLFRYLDKGDPQWLTLFDERYQQALQAFDRLDEELQNSTRQKLSTDTLAAMTVYGQGFQAIQQGYDQQNRLVSDTLDQLGPQIRVWAGEMSESVETDFKVEAGITNSLVVQTQMLLVVTMFVATVIGIFLGWQISLSITKPLNQVVTAATNVTQGDLSQHVMVQSKDELGVLGRAFNDMTASLREAQKNAVGKEVIETAVSQYNLFIEQVTQGDLTTRLSDNVLQDNKNDELVSLGHNLNRMVERLGDMTNQIREATASISSASAEILAATTQQASGANEQSAAINQTTSTISEVKMIVEQAYQKAQSVAQKARQTGNISRTGQDAVIETIDGMSQIKEKVSGIAENILALSEQTQQIGEITATVNDIASQSNLLALNASVEAARAGEHGKGFAVVAVEVRNLAEQSKQATAQVKAILGEIQQATNAAVMATEEGSKGVDSGVQLTQEAGNTISELAGSIEESANLADQIVASAQQQTTGMEQISLAMGNINQATMQGLSSTRQTERSAQDLSSVSQQLEGLVAQYKLN